MKYTDEELDHAALADLLHDADCAESQAHNGPYFPERGITKESLHDYAVECRQKAETYRNGGAHEAVLATPEPEFDRINHGPYAHPTVEAAWKEGESWTPETARRQRGGTVGS